MWIWHAAVVAEYRKPLHELAKHHHLDLTLLSPRRWPERAGQMVHAESDPPEVAAASNYRHITARTLFTGFYYIYLFPSLLYQLLKYRPQIIYCYEEAHTLIAALTLLFRRIFLPDSKVLLYAAQNIKKRYPFLFRLCERYCFKGADAILACGTKVAETLRSKGYRGPLHVVALPTDVHTFTPDPVKREAGRRALGLHPGDLVVGYAGKFVEEKGLRTLLDAFARVAELHKDAHLVLAGGGPLRDELAATAQRLGLAGRVHMPGVIHNSELPQFMNALDVFVLPSETRSNWREQFGRVAVEALACGTPVVGSDSGEIPTVLGDAGLVFCEGDQDALAGCLLEVLSSPEVRASLSRLGRERAVRLFSVEQVARKHLAIYEEVG
ncbi:MAG: glycosyltransferase [Chloroflexia bacterium]